MATPRIFISYRREDSSGHAGRLFDRLVERFGRENVFRDFDTIAAGDDFVESLRQRIAHSDVVLVVIGPRWLTATNEEGNWRLADENDWVRTEIEAALERNIRVIPVLVQGAAMPRAKDLPAALAKLAQRNAIEIRDASFDQDLRVLLDQLGPTWRHSLSRALLRRPVYAALAIVLASLLGVWLYPYVAMTPERARISLVQMGLRYDEDTLIRSATRNDMQAVRLLLAAGMPVNTPAGSDALRYAADRLHLEMVKLLFERGARDDRALGEAVAPPDKRDVFNFLLAHQPSSAALGAALRTAAGTSYSDLVRTLLDRGVDVNARPVSESALPLTALHAAARAWRLDHVVLLIARGADVNAASREGETALHEAIGARSGDEAADERELIGILQVLVQKGANINARWRNLSNWQPTPLLQAIRLRRSVTTLWLLEHGADTNVWAGDPGTDLNPLMLAAQSGLADVVQVLLAKGVPVDQRNANGETALIVAFYGGRADRACAQALLAAGADVNAHDNEGRTALMWATRRIVDMEPIRLLLAAGASVNATDKGGWSALMYAAQADYSDAVRELLGARADRSLRNKEGQDALMIASEAKNLNVVRLLSARGTAANAAGKQVR